MGNLDFSANADQLKELAAYMASQINVPTIGIGGGYAPIGTINFFDATVAPQDWLACDGSVYNIADYPQLADWYEAQHGASNFYGGNGTTTFAVPDLQGEFLRGTGTNGHTNQGSGANVGEHQDATTIPTFYSAPGMLGARYSSDYVMHSNPDKEFGDATSWTEVTGSTGSYSGASTRYTSRPTNTSFLICVKAVVAGEVYSTEERVVGTWIGGEKIYKKTWNNLNLQLSSDSWTNTPITTNGISKLIGAIVHSSNGTVITSINCAMDGDYVNINNTSQTTLYGDSLTLQYTKTTDG